MIIFLKKNKRLVFLILLAIILLTIGIMFLVLKNRDFDSQTKNFLINYNNSEKGTNKFSGVLKPSTNAKDGISNVIRLRLKKNSKFGATGTIKLHINEDTDAVLTTILPAYCKNDATDEILANANTKSLCTETGGVWYGFKENYCENPITLERITEHDNEDTCVNNGGRWTGVGSPLKYAIYDTSDKDANPFAVGYISTGDIGNDITIKRNIVLNERKKDIYIYIWVDKYLTDNTYNGLLFSSDILFSEK